MDIEQVIQCERINVVGTSGSGKSTFGRQLAELLNLPFYEIDAIYWKPNWQQASDHELIEGVAKMTSQDRWVLDGNYSKTLPDKWRRVQLVVWLDLPFARTVCRVTCRTVRRIIARDEIWPGTGNCESFGKSFLSPDSVIWWAITTHRKNRKAYRDLMASSDYSHVEFVRLRSPRSVAKFLAELRRALGHSHQANS